MSSPPSFDDLRLVESVVRTGSVGSAARELRISQPSASQRLSRLERRTGLRLFDRDTQGARPTVAGAELARRAEHILGHLDQVMSAVRRATLTRPLRVGTFPSLSAQLFPVLADLLRSPGIEQHADHGQRLIEWVAEGSLDAAVVAIAGQFVLPTGVSARLVGRDVLVCLLPPGVPAPRGRRQPFRDISVAYATYDLGADELHARLAALGAHPRRAATISTAMEMARRSGHPAVLPRSAVRRDQRAGARTADLPFTTRLRLSLVTRSTPDPRLVAVLPALREGMGLTG